MQYLSYLEGMARVRELTGLAHISDPIQNIAEMLSKGQFAILDIGNQRSRDGRAYRVIFAFGLATVTAVSFRDCQLTSLRNEGLRIQGGPLDIPSANHSPPIILGSVESRADSSDVALNFARPLEIRLEIRASTPGEGTFQLLFAIEYRGKLLRCKSSPIKTQLTGEREHLEFEVPAVIAEDENVQEFLDSASFIELSSIFVAIGSEVQDGSGKIAIHSNWAFGFLPANYVD